MGVPFEALIPYGIIVAMFGVTGVGLSTVKYYSNGRKNPRRGIDQWDQRITGIFRGQDSSHEAPVGFELNRPWKAERRFF
ncbi:hypothetical protein AJ79_05990 [Helicocarpus griseus UAMH5409]|uniref:NADH dehydrogenase [ubiquinone] 1 alpha subcomplex subunit 1 n=1 Tax=Helicocarpus griseus UAMH5409 TaxID=1447875 RepID=A0A2B7XHV6_9EURO|nr:hypothetical protein AJ79_05990 [Helicocarpus griseus UAMH5409]